MSITLVRNDERTDLREDGQTVGYVENYKLFGFNNFGYGEEICQIEHQSEIVPKFKEWRKSLSTKELEL